MYLRISFFDLINTLKFANNNLISITLISNKIEVEIRATNLNFVMF